MRINFFLINFVNFPLSYQTWGAWCVVPSPIMKSIWFKLFQVTFNEYLIFA